MEFEQELALILGQKDLELLKAHDTIRTLTAELEQFRNPEPVEEPEQTE